MSYFNFQNYDLSHLDAFSLKYNYNEKADVIKEININIEFGFHCFTNDLFYYDKNKNKIPKDNINKDLLITHLNETREFNLLRYEQSKQLPQLMQTLFKKDTNICFYSGKSNKGKIVYFRKETILHNSDNYDYYIFFNSTRQKQILFYITSAYHREDNYDKLFSDNKIKLNTIIKKTLS
jgi:hypothetical protein